MMPLDNPTSTAPRTRRRTVPGTRVRARLTAAYPRELMFSVPLRDDITTIGRAPGSGRVPLEHDTISRAHATIRFDSVAGVHSIRDLGSHNGTSVNGVNLGPDDEVVLEDGAVVLLGGVVLVYERGRRAALEDDRVDRDSVPGRSRAAELLRAMVSRAAGDPSPVLVVGETGTGKEWIARELHRLSGRSGRLVAINCAALSPQLFESELFGHVRGAFTGATTDRRGVFADADGGTLFLDELGELPGDLQAKLLRVLEEGEIRPVGGTKTRAVDVRVIAATNRDLRADVASGAFRRDLYARLALWEIHVPALRERRLDLFLWIEKLHSRWAQQRSRGGVSPAPAFRPDVAMRLALHDWPENLREVDRLVHSLTASSSDQRRVQLDDLPNWLTETDDPIARAAPRPARRPSPSRDQFIADHARLGGNVSALARHYGRDRRQIYRWLDAHGLR